MFIQAVSRPTLVTFLENPKLSPDQPWLLFLEIHSALGDDRFQLVCLPCRVAGQLSILVSIYADKPRVVGLREAHCAVVYCGFE
ncbi:hypothetical protein AKJ16_DCAP22515 [Drosera capensis]